MTHLTRILPLALIAAAFLAGCGSERSSETTAPVETGAEGGAAQESGAAGPEAPAGVRAKSCGQGLRVTGVDCATGSRIAAGWHASSSCPPAKGQSRSACSVGGFRCLAVVVDRGLAVTCARPGRSVAFIAERG